jgi:outer membrane protein TolC
MIPTSRLKMLTSALLLLVTVFAGAQVPANQTSSTYRTILDTSRVTDIREKLVQMALQNPNFEIADRKVGVADYSLRKAKGGWLNLFQASGNLNELSIKQTTTAVNGVPVNLYPRYNFALTLPFDFFSAKSNDVKIARENLYIAEAEKNEQYRQIRREVLSKYEDYLMFKEKLELQSRITQSEYTEYKLAEKDFEDNLITAAAFKKSEDAYLNQEMLKSQATRDYNVVKIELEQMIGVSIDDVLGKK